MKNYTPKFGGITALAIFWWAFVFVSVNTVYRELALSKPWLFTLNYVTMATIICVPSLFTTKHHNRGIKLLRKKNYLGSIEEFEISYRFFSKHKIIDNLRFIISFSPIDESFRELALCYIAYNYTLLGDLEKSKGYYMKALAEFPKSEIARDSLIELETASDLARMEN